MTPSSRPAPPLRHAGVADTQSSQRQAPLHHVMSLA